MGIHGLLAPLKAFGYVISNLNVFFTLSVVFSKDMFIKSALFKQIYC